MCQVDVKLSSISMVSMSGLKLYILDGVCRKEGERKVIEWSGEREGRGKGAEGKRQKEASTLTGKRFLFPPVHTTRGLQRTSY